MPIANWKTQSFNVIQSLLFNNPHRVIEYSVQDENGEWKNRADSPALVTRLYEYEATDERTCLQTIQFVHHMLIPLGGRHVNELHIHPDAEEIVVITRGSGMALVGEESNDVETGDVIYVPPRTPHEFRNTGEELLGVLFICVSTGEGLSKLAAARDGVVE
ncbi:MAG: cupin domain-containing protein [Planctomycetota bacterium]|nr:cupin domain-containing protein [Planctomycetota bacterium]